MYEVLKYCKECYRLHGRPISKYRFWYDCQKINCWAQNQGRDY